MSGSIDAGASPALPPEEQARSDCYALISRIFFAPPDAALLVSMGIAAGEAPADGVAGDLQRAWVELQQAARAAGAESLTDAYDALFTSVGKALVSPYTSGYAAPSAPDRHLVRLRDRLASWNLARKSSTFEMEDHVSGVCDVMRWLIEQGQPVAEQQAFFVEFVYPGASALCAAVNKATAAAFYQRAADFTRIFLELEKSAFEIFEPV
jgi:TorA maturation chaperone TorD